MVVSSEIYVELHLLLYFNIAVDVYISNIYEQDVDWGHQLSRFTIESWYTNYHLNLLNSYDS